MRGLCPVARCAVQCLGRWWASEPGDMLRAGAGRVSTPREYVRVISSETAVGAGRVSTALSTFA